MERDEIVEIGIDTDERLYVTPKTKRFPYIYREAMEVYWDDEKRVLYAPKPKEWSYFRWYVQILNAAKQQLYILSITENTQWINIPEALKNEIVHCQISSDQQKYVSSI